MSRHYPPASRRREQTDSRNLIGKVSRRFSSGPPRCIDFSRGFATTRRIEREIFEYLFELPLGSNLRSTKYAQAVKRDRTERRTIPLVPVRLSNLRNFVTTQFLIAFTGNFGSSLSTTTGSRGWASLCGAGNTIYRFDGRRTRPNRIGIRQQKPTSIRIRSVS